MLDCVQQVGRTGVLNQRLFEQRSIKQARPFVRVARADDEHVVHGVRAGGAAVGHECQRADDDFLPVDLTICSDAAQCRDHVSVTQLSDACFATDLVLQGQQRQFKG